MTLAAGTKVGPYEIIAPLGAGGMGEVYRAKDTRLGRDVAIKALPEGFAQDPERLARFEREARLLASLNHPNVAGIHGVEEVESNRYLVLEFVEGETLAAHVARGPLPVEEALEICRQVAAGVEAAHEAGVVHRDLKPGNVMLKSDGTVKVLDFGLAKSGGSERAGSDPNLSASPTLTAAATSAGVILGTAAYMSPEQARGRAVDKRSDIWSFGCLLYECLTGRQSFRGETVSDTIASIIKTEPDLSRLPGETPARVRELLARCLAKDARERLRDIGEARIVLAAPGGVGTAGTSEDATTGATRGARRWLAPAVVAVLAVAATVAAMLVMRPAARSGAVRRFRVPVEGLETAFFTPLALTHDGRAIAYEADDRIWIRRLDRIDAVEVPGSARGRAPFWSWDQSTVCFSAGKKLWAFTPGADRSREICDIPESGEIVGGAWSADARIVMAVWRGGLYEVPAAGGEARPTIAPDSSTVDFHGPSFLPDGRTLLLFVHDRGEHGAVAVVQGSPPRLRRVVAEPRAASVSYSPSGHLLVTRESGPKSGETWAVPFSVRSLKATGPAFRVQTGASFASSSSDGLLVTAEDPAPQLGQLAWRGRDGSAGALIGEPQHALSGPALSPEGDRIAYSAIQDGVTSIWVQDLKRGTRTRVASGTGWVGDPAWAPDGSRVFFARRLDVMAMVIQSAASDGAGSPDSIVRGQQPTVSPDGRHLVYTVDRRGSGDLWTVALDAPGDAKPFVATPADEGSPSFSPDGHWIAYTSDETGRTEVHLRRFPEGDMRLQVSVEGGAWPRWTRRGDGIFFVKRDTLELVPVVLGSRPTLGLPRPLFSTRAEEFILRRSNSAGEPADVDHDGSRFLVVRQAAPPPPRSLLFVENWFEEFRRP